MTLSKTASLSAVLAFLAMSPPARAHDFWINNSGYRSPVDGSHCCGNNDCSAYTPDQVGVTPTGYSLPTGELVPFSEALKSEDGEYWRCKRSDGSRRCFFAPMPSS